MRRRTARQSGLRGRPVAVGGAADKRGVVAAASYEARRLRRAIGDTDGARRPALPAARHRPARLHRSTAPSRSRCSSSSGSVTPLVEPLSLDEAYLDVTENAWGEALGMNVARRLKAAIRGADRAHRVGGRGAEQVPGEDRVRLAQAGRPDGHRAGAGRAASCRGCRSTRCGASARSPRGGCAPAASSELVDVRTADGEHAARRRRQPAPTGCSSWRAARTTARSSRTASRSRRAARTPSPATSPTSTEIRGQSTRWRGTPPPGWSEAACSARTVTIKVRYDDFTTITRSHSEAPAPRSRRIVSRAVGLLDRTDAGRRPVRLLGVSVHNLTETDAAPPVPEGPQPRLPFED